MKYTPDFSSRFRILKGGKISLVVSALVAGSTISFASPTGGQVTSGSASIAQNGSITTINQSTNKASINWNSFSIAPSETVNFVQPSAQSVTLNRVIGTSQSLLQGAMNANGQVFLLNPNGVLFSKDTQINVGGLVASTLNITDENFQAGNYVFEGNSQNSVLNMGTITAHNGGYVAMMGKSVGNEGTIVATMGSVQMASGEKISLNLNGNSLVKLTIDQGTLNALVENKGLIQADGGQVYLTTQALNTILDGMVNNTGIIEAQSLNNVDGKVILFAHGGTAQVGGTIEAKDGFVETSGKEFSVADGTIIKAKEWLIDPADITIESSGSTTDLAGSSIKASFIESTLNDGTGVTLTADNDININENLSWNLSLFTLTAGNDINVNAVMSATGTAELALNYTDLTFTAFDGKVALASTSSLTLNTDSYTIIQNLTDLAALTLNDSTAKYVLGTDITDNTSFASIGNGGVGIDGSFTGTFNGLGHSITNLTISEDGDWDSNVPNGVGLFGNIAGTVNISNLALINPTVTNTSEALDVAPTGALVGFAASTTSGATVYHPTISNIIVTGATVTATGNAGGALGSIDRGVVENVNVSTSNIAGYSYVGGVAGRATASTIDGVSSIGNHITTGTYGAGGIVGKLDSGGVETILQNSNASGNTLVGNQDIGGIVGYMDFLDSMFTLSNNYYKLDDTTINTTLGVITYGGIYAGQYNTWLTGSKAALVVADYLGAQAPASESDVAAYVINDMQDLKDLLAFTTTPNTDIKLANNIALDAGFYLPMLNGFIEGKGYTISGLNVNQPYNANIGLVGVLNGNISNLTLASPTLSGYSNVGSLAGTMLAGMIYNTTATGVNISVEASDTDVSNIGGLIGYADYTTFTVIGESSASGAIAINLAGNSGDGYSIANIGGLVGSVGGSASNGDTGMITNEVSKTTDVSITIGADAPTANTFSVGRVGGLVGVNEAELVEGEFLISNATATGDILISSVNTAGFDAYSIGGAVGKSMYSLNNIIANNDITITATDDSNYIGGVIGYAYGLSISNSSYSGDIAITTDGEFTEVGGIVGSMRTRYSTISDSSSAGTITLTASNASNIGGAVGNARATNFVTVTSSVAIDATDVDEGENIGGLVGYNTVTLDGDTHQFGTITNSFATGAITAPNMNNVGGLVGYIEVDEDNADSVIASHATGAVVGHDKTGGLIGYNQYGDISYSYSQGTVTGNDNTGGLIGYNEQGTITDSHTIGNVEGNRYTGGLVGYNNGGTIANSSALGDVTSTENYVGGLVGYNDGDDYDALITDSYATGAVSGVRMVGGLAGFNWAGNADGIISNSYATGAVSGNEIYIGGLVGANENYSSGDAVIENSYATGAVSGIAKVGGLVGENAFWGTEGVDTGVVKITNSYATGTVNGAGNVGGLLGEGLLSTIETSYATGEVTGTTQRIGGLIGYANGDRIENVFATGDVTNTSAASTTTGALIGMSVNGSVTTSYANGLITVGAETSATIGGLIGANDADSTSVSDSFYNKTLNVGKSDEDASGKTTGELKLLNTYDENNWDIAVDSTLTDMYPRLAASGSDTVWIINPATTGESGPTAEEIAAAALAAQQAADAAAALAAQQAAEAAAALAAQQVVDAAAALAAQQAADAAAALAAQEAADAAAALAAQQAADAAAALAAQQAADAAAALAAQQAADAAAALAAQQAADAAAALAAQEAARIAVEQSKITNDIITTIVNSTTVAPVMPIVIAPFTSQPQQVQTQVQNNVLMQSIIPQASTNGGSFGLVGSPDGTTPLQTITMEQLQSGATLQGMGEIRVPLGNNSMVELVNGGVNLPSGVSQEFYVVANNDTVSGSGIGKSNNKKAKK